MADPGGIQCHLSTLRIKQGVSDSYGPTHMMVILTIQTWQHYSN